MPIKETLRCNDSLYSSRGIVDGGVEEVMIKVEISGVRGQGASRVTKVSDISALRRTPPKFVCISPIILL